MLRIFFCLIYFFIFWNSSELSCHLVWCAATLWFQASSCHRATARQNTAGDPGAATSGQDVCVLRERWMIYKDWWLSVPGKSGNRASVLENVTRSRKTYPRPPPRFISPSFFYFCWCGIRKQTMHAVQMQCLYLSSARTLDAWALWQI